MLRDPDGGVVHGRNVITTSGQHKIKNERNALTDIP